MLQSPMCQSQEMKWSVLAAIVDRGNKITQLNRKPLSGKDGGSYRSMQFHFI